MILMRNELRLRSQPSALARTFMVLSLMALAVALMARSALAQEQAEPFDLHGVVVDAGGKPLVGAFVGLAGSDWGALTSKTGRFIIPDVYPGRLELTAEQLGYATRRWVGMVGPGDAPLVIELDADPLVLPGLTVVTDRFQSRRNATATTVQAYDRNDLATAHQNTVMDFVRSRAGVPVVGCPGTTFSSLCVISRGRVVEPSVYVDEVPVIAGVDYLDSFRPHELYMVEVYARGRHIRAYTTQFMERAAKSRLQPIPFIF